MSGFRLDKDLASVGRFRQLVAASAAGKGRDGSEQIAINTRCLDGVDLERW